MLTRSPHRIRVAARRSISATAVVAALVAALAAGGATEAGTATETDVMAWLDDVSGAMKIDATSTCASGTPTSVAYRNDRVVVRTWTDTVTIGNQVDAIFDTMYGAGAYISSVETIHYKAPPGQPDTAPLLSVNLVPRASGYDVVQASRLMRSLHGETTSPDYALTPSAPYSHYFPNGAPEPYAGALVQRANLTPIGAPIPNVTVGTGVKVFVYDTGLAAKAVNELPNVTVFQSIDDDRPNADKSGDPKLVDQPAAGHGKAISGVISTIAPGATIKVVRVNSRSGLLTDVDAARRIAETFASITQVNNLPDLLVMSFGTTVCDITAGNGAAYLEPLGTQGVAEMVDRFDPVKPRGMLIVASAGNMASSRPHYPAAFDSVFGIGALDGTKDGDANPWSNASKTAPVADFSNTGTWVDAYAVGRDLPANHVIGGLRFQFGGPLIDGRASIDGTSFSGPVTTGHLAELMSVTGLSARAARDELLDGGVAPLPRCGSNTVQSGVAIVLPSFAADIDDQATAPPVPC